MIFKCKNCGGNSVYSPEKKMMYCPFCESENSEERQYEHARIQVCPNCGGEVACTEHTSALQCPYCDNYIILDERIEGAYAPGRIIPFKFGREKVKEMIRDKFKKCTFAPTDFLSEARLNTITGEYIPFWMYDYDTRCQFQGEGIKRRTWVSGNIEYTETSYYQVVRDMNIAFQRIPADASVKMPDSIMDLLEPYNYGELVDFRPEYMSGFLGEKYNMGAEIIENRAHAKMESSAAAMLQQSIRGYSSLTPAYRNIAAPSPDTEYDLLPVWVYRYTYKEKEYPFYVNGQTGKIIGTTPISKAKVWAYGATLWACLTAAIALIGVIMR